MSVITQHSNEDGDRVPPLPKLTVSQGDRKYTGQPTELRELPTVISMGKGKSKREVLWGELQVG